MIFKNTNLNLSNEKTKDFVAGLVALVFVLTAGYLALNRFNSNDSDSQLGIGGDITTDENGVQISDRDEQEEGAVAGSSSYTDWWSATDYQQGDIATGSYTVASGDTLWEIAEAVYGDGAMWTNILDANSGSIGYLADGTQALIVPGQVLTIN